MNTTNARLVYATETCTRCAGTGTHSKCEMHGTDCFKCVVAGNPRGLQSTKDAIAARKAIAAFRDALLTVDAGTLKVGDMINATSTRSGTSRHGKASQLTIREIAPVRVAAISAEISNEMRAGRTFEQLAAAVEAGEINGTVSRAFYVVGDKQTVSVAVGSTVQRMPTAEDIAKIVAFARTLAGVTVVGG